MHQFPRPRRTLSAVAAAAALAACAAVAPSAGAAEIDQAFVPPPGQNLGFTLDGLWDYIGQSFTAGVSGELVAADYYFYFFTQNDEPVTDSDVLYSVHLVENGQITATVLASQLVPNDQVPVVGLNPFLNVQFDNPAQIVAGQAYALVVSTPDEPIGHPAGGSGSWAGLAEGGYAGGTDHGGNTFPIGTENSLGDLFFATYVEVPEPSSLAGLAAVGLAALARRRR